MDIVIIQMAPTTVRVLKDGKESAAMSVSLCMTVAFVVGEKDKPPNMPNVPTNNKFT